MLINVHELLLERRGCLDSSHTDEIQTKIWLDSLDINVRMLQCHYVHNYLGELYTSLVQYCHSHSSPYTY